MATNFAFVPPDDRPSRCIPSALAAEYKRCHEEMLAAIEAMDKLACHPVPNQLRLSHTRLRITRAGAECRTAFAKIERILSSEPSIAANRVIGVLQRQHRELKAASRHHLAFWTHAQANEDWPGYCRSSAEIRQMWRALIERERKLLYPLLES